MVAADRVANADAVVVVAVDAVVLIVVVVVSTVVDGMDDDAKLVWLSWRPQLKGHHEPNILSIVSLHFQLQIDFTFRPSFINSENFRVFSFQRLFNLLS